MIRNFCRRLCSSTTNLASKKRAISTGGCGAGEENKAEEKELNKPKEHIKSTNPTRVQNSLECLDLEQLDELIFRSTTSWLPPGSRAVFGGQVIGQAMLAAHSSRATTTAKIHSFHSYFLAPGDPNIPILYQVKKLRDGKMFQSRSIVAMQKGKAIFHSMASFHEQEDEDYKHQYEMPEAPPPDSLPSLIDVQRNLLKSNKIPEAMKKALAEQLEQDMPGFPIDVRYCDVSRADPLVELPRPPRQMVWMRTIEPLGDDEHLHRCVAAYASDWSLCTTALLPSGAIFASPRVKMLTSLDHAIWLHDKFRFDEWMLYEMESPWAGNARGVSFGRMFTQDGRLALTVAQEALMRLQKKPQT